MRVIRIFLVLKIMPRWLYLEALNFKGEMGISGECVTHIIQQVYEKLPVSTINLFIRLRYLQQSFFLTKIALKTFQKKCPMDFIIVIYHLITTFSFLPSGHLLLF